MDRGWFRGYVLYLNGTPRAFWHGNAYKGVFGVGATGFDPALRRRAARNVPPHARRRGPRRARVVHTLDFGFGDAEYKRHFGDERRPEEDVVLVEPRRDAVALNLARSARPRDDAGCARRAARAGRSTTARRRRRRERLAEKAKQ